MKGTGAKRNVCHGSCVSTGAKFPVAPVESAPMQVTFPLLCIVLVVDFLLLASIILAQKSDQTNPINALIQPMSICAYRLLKPTYFRPILT